MILKPVADFNSKLISQSVKVCGNVHDTVREKNQLSKQHIWYVPNFASKKKKESHKQTVQTARNTSKCQGWLFQNVKSGRIMNDF